MVCYDIEFPELVRMLVESGVEIILNPFATDERKSYLRVGYCAQARAVKNMVYVVMSGNVGGLSHSPSMTINFGQAAICTPSAFAFPMNGIAAEGIVNTQTVVIADLDLGALDIQRQSASVRPLLDRPPPRYLRAHRQDSGGTHYGCVTDSVTPDRATVTLRPSYLHNRERNSHAKDRSIHRPRAQGLRLSGAIRGVGRRAKQAGPGQRRGTC
ncbi:MAG: nitrilase-related carbon-nitrogen hydrolase [Rhodanobacter sp.]